MTLWACEECGGDYEEDGAGNGLCEGCYDSHFIDAAPSLPVPSTADYRHEPEGA